MRLHPGLSGMSKVFVALVTVDTVELTWYIPAERVGVGVGHSRPMLDGEVN